MNNVSKATTYMLDEPSLWMRQEIHNLRYFIGIASRNNPSVFSKNPNTLTMTY